MGLDCSHDAFSGAYSAFNRFRQAVARAAGGSYPPHYFYSENGIADLDSSKDQNFFYLPDEMTAETAPGLYEFLSHSDCDGEISPEMCAFVADELEALLPAIEAMGDGDGHIARNGGYGPVARRFIDGCRDAAAANEPLEFF